jgi:hypothetical protein
LRLELTTDAQLAADGQEPLAYLVGNGQGAPELLEGFRVAPTGENADDWFAVSDLLGDNPLDGFDLDWNIDHDDSFGSSE